MPALWVLFTLWGGNIYHILNEEIFGCLNLEMSCEQTKLTLLQPEQGPRFTENLKSKENTLGSFKKVQKWSREHL